MNEFRVLPKYRYRIEPGFDRRGGVLFQTIAASGAAD